jgi:peptidoglycan/xylan/chitin deacetylase (PgdA/CDA1 family)
MGLLETKAPILFHTASSATGWSIAGGNGAIQMGSLPDGTARLRATTNANQGLQADLAISGTWANRSGIEAWVYVNEPKGDRTQAFGVLQLRDGGNVFAANIQITRGWNHLRLARTDFTVAAGTPNWNSTNFSVMRFRLEAQVGVAHDVILDRFAYAGHSRPMVCVMFDDGYTTVQTAAKPIMDAAGVPGTVAVIASRVGTNLYLTVEQLKQLQADGWAMVNHSADHLQSVLPTGTIAQATEQVSRGAQFLRDNGLSENGSDSIYCAPFGEWGENYLEGARRAGATFFRGTIATNPAQPSYPGRGDSLQGLDPHPCFAIVASTTLAQIIDHLQRCFEAGRSTILLFHAVTPTIANANIDYLESNFRQVVNYLSSNRARYRAVTLPEYVYALKS